MTLDEKIGQLWQTGLDPDSDKVLADALRNGGISSFLGSSEIIETPVMRNKLQHIVVEQSRLGIPLIFGHDVIHGFRTIFPIPLALSCAWEPELFEKSQTMSAREAAAAGIDWAFAPMVDLARDPRWGRIRKVLVRIRGSVRSMPRRACADFRARTSPTPTALSPA